MTQVSTIAGGRPTQAEAIVTADQDTIIGNGTTEDPLRSGSSGASSAPGVLSGSGTVHKGEPVFVATANVFTAASAAGISPIADAFVAGLTDREVTAGGDRSVLVKSTGIVTMTTAEWDAITGGSGGLTVGAYYLGSLGGLSTTRLSTSGQKIVLVGIALNATQMQLQLGDPQVVP